MTFFRLLHSLAFAAVSATTLTLAPLHTAQAEQADQDESEQLSLTITEVPTPEEHLRYFKQQQLALQRQARFFGPAVLNPNPATPPQATLPQPTLPRPTLPQPTAPQAPTQPNLPPGSVQPPVGNLPGPTFPGGNLPAPTFPNPNFPGTTLPQMPNPPGSITVGGVRVTPNDIAVWVNIGKMVWDIIDSLGGRMKIEPMAGVGVLPAAVSAMTDLSGWKIAKPKTYEMKIKGAMGTAFSYTYTVGYTYGGSLGGKGQFLSNVQIIPFNVKCGWSWNCSTVANVGTAVNVGTETDPVPALPINMLVNAQGRLNAKAAGVQFIAYGDGRLEQTVQDFGAN